MKEFKNQLPFDIRLDLYKAYLNYTYLLNKYGVQEKTLEWFKSYLLHVMQKTVIINNGKEIKLICY